jgi:hypothetical protein
MRTSPSIFLVSVALATIAAGCSRGSHERSADSAVKTVEALPTPGGPAQTSSTPDPDSLGITNKSGAVLLSVAHDSVSMGFSPATLEKIRRETDTAGAGTGFGGMIERTVKSSVQSMLSKRVMVPVADIESARYEDGAIRFTYRTRPNGMKLEDVKIDKEPVLESFSEDDARRFVKAVDARLQQR